MKQFRRILAVVLSAAMLLPGTVYATAKEDAYGQRGESAASTEQQSEYSPREVEMDYASLKSQLLKEEYPEFTKDIPQTELDWDAVGTVKNTRVTSLPDVDFVDGRLLVKVERSVSLMDSGSIFDGIAASADTLFSVTEPAAEDDGVMLASAEEPTADWFRVELADGVDMLDAWNQLLSEKTVLRVEPDYLVQAADVKEITADDPYLHSQGWLDQIGAPEAWKQVSNPGSNVVVAVVDSGVDLDHPDLQDRLLSGYDFVEGDADPDDVDGHGTHVAGIVAAEKNDIGVRGVAYEADILPVRVLDDYGSGSTSAIADGIAWSAGAVIEGVSNVNRKANIINLSLGGFHDSWIQRDAIDFAIRQGCLVVAAAGNESLPTTYAGDSFFGATVSPANTPGVLTVMAMNQRADANGDWVTSFSNYDADPGEGAEYEIMAPGANIYSTGIDGDYVYMNGTSMACPVAAGAAAVLMGMGCTAAEAWERLVSTAPVKQGKTQPNGTVRSYPALDLEAAVVMKKNGSTAYQKGPVAANAYVEAALADINFGYGAVNFDGINTYDRLYYYNGALKSTVSVCFENFGGAGTVSVTGTIGGCTVSANSVNVTAGQFVTIPLQIAGTPASVNGEVSVDLYVNGQTLNCYELTAVDLKTPASSGKFQVSGGYYVPNSAYVVLGGNTERTTVWVLDLPMNIPLNYTVEITPGDDDRSVIIYQPTKNQYIQTNYNSSTGAESELALISVMAIGGEGFAIYGFGSSYLLGCGMYDPWVVWATLVNQSYFMSTGYSALVQGGQFTCSSFTDFWSLEIDCASFLNNLVSRCTSSKLEISSAALGNTFIENYDGQDNTSVLCAYVPHADSDEGAGFKYNSVVGPMDFLLLSNTNYLAAIENVYYQPADDPYLMFEDGLQCHSASTVSSSLSDLASWGFAADSPVFVTGKSVEYDYNSTYGSVDYTITFNLSTAIDEYCWPYVYSYSDPMTDNAEVLISADCKTVTANLTTMLTDLEMWNDYHLAGIYTADYISSEYNHYFWATELVGQVITTSVELESRMLDQVWLNPSSSGVAVNWSDSRIRSTDSAVILRSMDGAEPVQIGTVSSATIGTYTDATTEPGHIYEYLVYILRGSNTAYYGFTQFVAAKGTFHGGEDLTTTVEDSSSLTVGLASPWLAGGGGCLTYTLPEDMAAGIEFSMQVQESGLTLSAVNNGDGTETITIGLPEESSGLAAGELFTITAENGYTFQKVEDDIVAHKGGTLLLWHLGNYKAVAAGYQSGKMMGVGVADQWNESCQIQTGNAAAWKLFVTAGNWVPSQPAQNIV